MCRECVRVGNRDVGDLFSKSQRIKFLFYKPYMSTKSRLSPGFSILILQGSQEITVLLVKTNIKYSQYDRVRLTYLVFCKINEHNQKLQPLFVLKI